MKKLLLALLAALLAIPFLTRAATPIEPIQSILTYGKDDQRVVVRGQVLSKVDDEEYVIGDGTGRIRVEIDDDLVKEHALAVGAHVEIMGEVDRNVFSEPSIEAKRVAVLVPRPVLPAPAAGPPAY